MGPSGGEGRRLPILLPIPDPRGTLSQMQSLTRFLRNPRIIVGELGLLTVVFVLSTIVPSAGEEGAASGRLEAGSAPLFARVSSALGLDHLFTSPVFLTLVVLALLSLAVVLKEQLTRAWRLWTGASRVAGASGAPYRREEVFPGEFPAGAFPREVRIRGAAGVWGSPLFHLGILLIVAAGILRALFGADAVVDLMAGETLLPRSDQFGRQWPGLLARPFAFPVVVRLEELHVTRYPSGEARWVEGTLRLGEGAGSEAVPIAINGPVSRELHTLYLRAIGGAAALVEVRRASGKEQHAILLRESGRGSEGAALLEDGTLLRATSSGGGIGRIPERIDFRAVRDGALAAVGQLARNEAMALPDGTLVAVAEIVPWAQFSARRDVAAPVVYIGFLFVCAGGLLMMAVVRVESGSTLERVPEGVKLTVWLRPQRFAPLFAPAFEELWKARSARFEAAAKEIAPARP